MSMSEEPLIRQPGKWLDEFPTAQESEEILKHSEIVYGITDEQRQDPDRIEEILNSLLPYSNSAMHFFYLMIKEGMQLHIEDNMVIDGKGIFFDIVDAFTDFTLQEVLTKKPKDGQLQDHQKAIIKGIELLTEHYNGSKTGELQAVTLPTEITIPVDKVTRMFLLNKLQIDTETAVKSGQIKKKREVIAPIVTVSLLDLPPGVDLSRNVEPFDSSVFGAVCSLQESGNKRFTGHDIYKVITGNPNARAAETALKMIDASWKRLTSISIRIDTGNMGDAYNFIRWVRDRRIIEGGTDTIYFQNQNGICESTVYSIHEEPILKTYAGFLGQIQRYPAKWLDTPINKTPEILIIQNALFEHIQAIPNISRRILYDSLFDRVDISAKTPAAERKKKAILRKHIRTMLEYWKECGVIQGYTEKKKGNTVYCVEIDKGDKINAISDKQGADPPEKSGNDPRKKW